MKSKFIVLEGGEGSGKSTQLRLLRKKLKNVPDVVFTREPGGTRAGKVMRKLLLSSDYAGELSILAELFLFCADRANHIDKVVRPALEKDKTVICDRFDPSTVAYQIYGRNHEEYEKIFLIINSIAKGKNVYGEINPDLVIFFDVDAEKGLCRARAREGEKTKFDMKDLHFHQKVRKAYHKQAQGNKNWKIINANLPVKEVEKQTWNIVREFLKI